MKNAARWLVAIPVMLLFVALGCGGEREQVMIPPRADLMGARTVAVLYFDNLSADPGLSFEFEQGLAHQLHGYYRVLDGHAVEATLHGQGLVRGMPLTSQLIREIGESLDVDVVITGEVTYYFEDVTMNAPTRTGLYDNETKARWSVGQTTQVLVNVNGRVVSTETGLTLYSKRVEGSYSSTASQVLPWTELAPPPPSMLPRPSRKDVPQGRMRAVKDAVDSFSVDLLPTYVWRRVE